MTYTYAILQIPRHSYFFIHNKLLLSGYANQFHFNKEGPLIDMHGIAVQAIEVTEDLQQRAASLHDKIHEVAQVRNVSNEVCTGWAPEEAIPMLAEALQEAAEHAKQDLQQQVLAWITGYAGPDLDGFFGKLLEALERRINTEYQWYTVDKFPPRRVPIEMTGSSGYIPPNDRFVCSGYYDPEYRPLSPWLDSTSTCIEDRGWIPTHWRYLTPGPEQQSLLVSFDRVKALQMAKDELWEMLLSQRAGNPPRNPELTQAAYNAVCEALGVKP